MTEAVILGYGKIFLGINDAELFARALAGLITQYGQVIDFGEVDLSVKSFYIGFMALLIRNDEFVKQFVDNSPEWILDYVIMPLLACVRYKTLSGAISNILKRLFSEMEKTSYAHEVPIYEEALEYAKAGGDFSRLGLPTNLKIKLYRAHEIAERQKAGTVPAVPALPEHRGKGEP